MSKLLKRTIVVILIFTLTFANFALVGKASATSIVETIFGKSVDTGHKNVAFEAFFGSEEEKETSIICDVNDENIAINMELGVREVGYLKDGTIEILSEDELNFEICEAKTIEKTVEQEAQVEEQSTVVEEKVENAVVVNLDNTVPEEKEPIVVNLDNTVQEEKQVEAPKVDEIIEEPSTENEQNVENSDEIIEQPEENTNVVADEIVEEPKEETNEVQEEKREENINQVIEQSEEVEKEIVEVKELYKEYVQEIENNKIVLKQINSNSEMKLSLPIQYKNESYVKENKFSSDAKVKLTGIYVDENGKEIKIEKEYKLTVSWKDERTIKVEPTVTKYLDYGAGVILQTLVKIDNTKEGNSLPIKQTELTLDVPSIGGIEPSNVLVVANSTQGTNGKQTGSVIFTKENWSYDKEQKKVNVLVKNDKQLIKFNQNENQFIIDESKIVEEERIYNVPGVDEYLVTYTYNGVKIPQEAIIVKTKIEAKVTTYSGVTQDENKFITTVGNEYEYKLEGQTGTIASLVVENNTPEVSKAYMYANYKNSEKYETEFITKSIINVSYKDIIENLRLEDEENFYIDKQGKTVKNSDIYYKSILISKSNFVDILGEQGQINITDVAGNPIITVNKDTQVNDAGNIEISFQGRTDRLYIEFSKPVKEGNLVIESHKGIKNSSIDKAGLLNIDSISTKSTIKAKYSYVQEVVNIATIETNTKLKDTITKANLVLSKQNFSTISMNENVEMKIEFNNNKDTSDMYGHSVFDIELPEHIETVEVTNTSILYGEGLEITSVEAIGKTIRITVDGTQEGINSGVLTNGTNIVLNANIKANIYTPMKEEIIKLKYINDEATQYDNQGIQEVKIAYSAPTGLVSVNSILNYKNDGTGMLTSVRQGRQTDVIEIASQAKTAKMEMIIMNNNNNTVSNVSILGRFPFEGLRDMVTLEPMGTNITPKLLSGIIGNEGFKVYYSENGDATRSLNNAENGWIENPVSLENLKSYLIVPVAQNYEMKPAEILRFSYDFEIPANLTREQNIYGTFLTYYTNNSITGITNEEECPDIVGITTGVGPELKLEIIPERDTVREYEEVPVKLVITNTGKVDAKNINVEFPIPTYTEYVSHSSESENIQANLETVEEEVVNKYLTDEESDWKEEKWNVQKSTLKVNCQELKINEKFEVIVVLKINRIFEQNELAFEAKMTANEILNPIVGNNVLNVEIAKIKLEENRTNTTIYKNEACNVGDEISFSIEVDNLLETNIGNINVSKEIPDEFEFIDSKVKRYSQEENAYVEVGTCDYNQETNAITYKIDEMNSLETMFIDYTVKVNGISENLTKSEIGTSVKADLENNETYNSNLLLTNIVIPIMKISQVASNTNTYLQNGESLRYTFNIKNEGDIDSGIIEFKNQIPQEMRIINVSYSYGEEFVDNIANFDNNVTITKNIEKGKELVINIDVKANLELDALEKTVTNFATINGENISEIKSNSITHIIKLTEQEIEEFENKQQVEDLQGTIQEEVVINKKYKISGTAWEDTNRNGMKDSDESLLRGIQVKLIDAENGIIKNTVKTDEIGNYIFTDVEKGRYLILFEYDTVKYTTTSCKKDGVDENANSDVVTTQVQQDGITSNAAVTEVIVVENGNILGIDIGLILADKFDLSLDTSITKVTIQTSKETTTNDYDNQKLIKEEIAAKYVSGSTVYIEYEIKVSNVGDIAGYVRKIVDYLPDGMMLNSSLESNSNWYTGSDGNVYTTSLANEVIAPGESKTLKLVLMKQMTDENTGILNNQVEIYEDYNIYGISDYDSKIGNKAQGEDDISFSDAIISIKTGEILIYISVILTIIMIGIIVVCIIYVKLF